MSDKYPGGFVTANAPAGFSVAFDGTGDFLQLADSTAWDLTGDYTIEMWLYSTATPVSTTFFQLGSSSNFLAIYLASATKYITTSGSLSITASTALALNSWNHMALVRSGSGTNNTVLYLNGVNVGQATNTTSFTGSASNGVRIGAEFPSDYYFNGYISNVRVVNGTALYTTTFTPPTQLFPVTNTQLLTCQSPTIIDTSSNGFTITAAGDAKVSNFTPFAAYQGFNPALGAAAGGVWTLDEAAYYQNNRIWPIYDPYFNQTTLMLHGNGTNAAQNNTFLDSSTNNFTITRNGNTTQGSFSPFSQTGWSNYFSSSANYLTVPYNANFTWSTGARTYEAWVYVTSVAANNAIFALSDLSSSNGFELYINTSSQVVFRYFTTTAQITTTTGTVPLNTWTHVAFVYDGTSNFTIYINGVSSATGTKTGSPVTPAAQLCIGRTNIGTAGDVFFSGYISNARFTTTTVYTSNFTPSNAPLTAVTGTTLLTCQDNRFVDDSANNATVTANGTVSVQAFSPFVPAYITPTTYSNWFDGTGDYLTAPNAAWMDLGTGSFTMECWVQFNTVGSTQMIVSSNYNAGTGGGGWAFLYRQDNTTLKFSCNSNVSYEKTWSPAAGTMYHVAVCRSGTDLRLFVNGVQLGTTSTSSDNISGSSLLFVGSNVSNPLPINGVISNMRIVTSALYTANFTPPTAPLTAITNTQLLTCQSSTFVDNSTNNFTITANGNVQPVTSPTPFPAKVDTTTLNSAYSTSLIGGSAYFDGTGDYLTLPANAAFNFNTGNFTLETWIYMPSFSTFQEIFSQGSGNFQGIGIYTTTSGKVHLDLGNGSSWYANAETTNSLKLNSWNHVAIVRQSTTYTIYLNGASDATTTTATFPSDASGASSYIAVYGPLTSQLFTGYLSGFRIVKGTGGAIYTSNFAPPVAPPTNITNTSLLTNFTNGAIFDNTAKNVLETVGNAQISTAQSKWGGSSMYFANGGTDYLINPYVNNPNFSFGGDFTVELWVYPTSTPDAYNCIIGNFSETGTTYGWNLMLTSGQLVHVNVAGTSNNSVQTVPLNTWSHLAITRAGSTVYIFVNGKRDTTTLTTSALAYNPVYPLRIGRQVDTTPRYFYGYMDDIRITKGVARYITNFTPPTSQLQDQ
jgi:hypothetical protein